jgi:hypothetical protein
VVVGERAARLGREGFFVEAGVAGEVGVAEVARQQQNVVPALPQRRQHDGKLKQAVVEVFPQAAVFDHLLRVAVGRADDARIEGDRFVAAHPLEGAVLKRTQELRLKVEAHLADLVEKDRPAVGLLELADALLLGVGKGALFVPEEGAFHQLRRHGRAVDLHERPLLAVGVVVNGLGDELLSGSAFPLHGDGDLCAHGFPHEAVHLLHRFALAHELAHAVALFHLVAQRVELALHARLFQRALERGLQLGHVVLPFGHVVVSAQLHRLDGRLDDALRRNHNDRQLRATLLQLLEHFDAAHARHHDVEQYHIGNRGVWGVQFIEKGAPLRIGGDLVLFALAQTMSHQPGVVAVVVNQGNSVTHSVRGEVM